MGGGEVIVADSGKACMRSLAQRIPTFVLLDITMPDMSGVDVLQAIRQQAAMQQLPVIALTAKAMSGDREKLLAAGFTGYISKPFTDLPAHIQAILNTI